VIVITAAIVALTVLAIVSLGWTIARVSRQRVSMHDGKLITSVMGEREATIPTSDIGVVLFLKENLNIPAQSKMGVFGYGGIIILNKAHRLIRVIQHYAGSTLELGPIYDQLPADEKIDFTGKTRADLVKLYPKSLGFFQLRGTAFWGLVPVLMVFGGLIVLVFVGVFLSAIFAFLI
jgi:hypothetical protein